MQRREDFIRSRIHAHSEALFATETGGDLPPCSPEDMWEKSTVFAVKKDGAVRAKILCSTLEEAEEELQRLGKGFFIETRPGERTRCANFCQVSGWCKQYQTYLKEKQND